ncbi:cytochrome c biogenesis protein ResB [bacterium]|nr:cytochrome c biogenesis protein ResB [bacterium]MBU1674388.1 cytochrome c biogenesis protein ResB [bacterium]
MYSREPHVQLEVDGDLQSFPVRLYRPGDPGPGRTLTAGGRDYRVSVEEYWPHFAQRLQAADTGPAALRLVVIGESGPEELFLLDGEARSPGGVRMRYVEGPLPAAADGARWGTVRVHVDGETTRCDVPDTLPATFASAGWTFTITEFQSDFKVGGGTSYEGDLGNPMIRVAIAAPDGREGEKILFAYHPDFSMGHGGAEEDFPALDVLYQLDRGLTIGRDAGGTLVARSTQPLASMGMDDVSAAVDLPAGRPFPLETALVYRSEGGGLAFMLNEALPHVQLQPALSQDERAPSAARISVVDASGARVETIVVKDDEREETVRIGDTEAILRLGSVVIDLPYSIHLDDFLLLNYPGSRNPASYESHVRLYDADRGIDGRPVRIYMNHPLSHRGYKHFQSSYDPDELGTVLSVNYDPGKVPTYLGYTLLALGFLMILARDLIWPVRKDERERSAA